jgi:hypothetical protein
LCKFTSPNDDPLVIDGNFMFKLFGRCEMMEAEIIDLIISYWKGSPDMKHLFDSRDRVFLGPFITTVCLLLLLSVILLVLFIHFVVVAFSDFYAFYCFLCFGFI